nr:hypothetical protein [Pseudomonas sp. H1h]
MDRSQLINSARSNIADLSRDNLGVPLLLLVMLATLLRLALNVASTRVVMLHGQVAFASRSNRRTVAPTFGMHFPVGASLLAKASTATTHVSSLYTEVCDG